MTDEVLVRAEHICKYFKIGGGRMLHGIPMARLVRGQVVALKQQEYIAAASHGRMSSARIIARHLLPNTLSVVIVRDAVHSERDLLGKRT